MFSMFMQTFAQLCSFDHSKLVFYRHLEGRSWHDDCWYSRQETTNTMSLYSRFRHAVPVYLAVAALIFTESPSARAANIITFADNANSCGGAVMCSTNGTTGYLINGTGQAFDLSTLSQWFQIDPGGANQLASQTEAEPDSGAGGFLVVNDTGAAITSYSITLVDTFNKRC